MHRKHRFRHPRDTKHRNKGNHTWTENLIFTDFTGISFCENYNQCTCKQHKDLNHIHHTKWCFFLHCIFQHNRRIIDRFHFLACSNHHFSLFKHHSLCHIAFSIQNLNVIKSGFRAGFVIFHIKQYRTIFRLSNNFALFHVNGLHRFIIHHYFHNLSRWAFFEWRT